MRQHITEEQWFEITGGQRASFLKTIDETSESNLRFYCESPVPRATSIGLALPLPAIGQLIQFLNAQRREISCHIEIGVRTVMSSIYWCVRIDKTMNAYNSPELVDALWKAVKDVLEGRE